MRFSDIPANLLGIMDIEQLADGIFPDEVASKIAMMLFVYSDLKVKRGGLCQVNDADMLKAYQAFAIGLSLEKLRRAGLLDFKITGGEMFKGFDYDMTIKPFYEKFAEYLGISLEEALEYRKQFEGDL